MLRVQAKAGGRMVMKDGIPAATGSHEMVEHLAGLITSELPKDVQAELAKLAVAVTAMSHAEQSFSMRLAHLAAAALFSTPPNLVLAKDVRQSLEQRVRRQRSPLVALLWNSPAVKVIIGLATLLYVGIPLSIFVLYRLMGVVGFNAQLADIDMLMFVSLAGALGSIVSILVRVHDFSNARQPDAMVLFFTGFFKPVVGAAFAIFIYAVINSGILPFRFDGGGESQSGHSSHIQYLYLALSFIAGFSERFARDIVLKAEGAVTGKEHQDLPL